MFKIFKSFAKKSKEEKAAILCMIGLFGAIISATVGDFWINSLVYDVAVTGFLEVVLVIGCFCMIRAICKMTSDRLPKLMAIAVFGFVGLLTTELIVDWIGFHLFAVELPDITAWYALPAFGTIFIGLIILVIRGFADARQRKKA